MPWEQRVRPAPSVKNSEAAGTTASSCCGGAGASRQPDPRFGDRKGPGGEAGGEETYRAQEGMPFPESELPRPGGPGCESPDPGRVPCLREQPSGPEIRGPSLRDAGSRPPSSLPVPQNPPAPPPRRPIRAPGELRTNLTKLVAGCAGLYLGVGRGPGSPAATAAGCTRLYHCLAALPLRPVPPPTPGPGEEPGPRPVQPRPIRAAPGSPPQGLGR